MLGKVGLLLGIVVWGLAPFALADDCKINPSNQLHVVENNYKGDVKVSFNGHDEITLRKNSKTTFRLTTILDYKKGPMVPLTSIAVTDIATGKRSFWRGSFSPKTCTEKQCAKTNAKGVCTDYEHNDGIKIIKVVITKELDFKIYNT